MAIVVEATYENGVLKPAEPLPLEENHKVEVTIRDPASVQAALEAVRRTAGLIQWTGDPEILRRIAEDPEFGIEESP